MTDRAGPTQTQDKPVADAVFFGTSEMANRCRAFDWGSTSLGPADRWSHSLRTVVSTMLASRHPMFLWWGPDLVQIFNDGYLPSFGTTGRDVVALGAPGRRHWAEIWPIIGPEIESVLTDGTATWHEDHLVPIERNGRLDDVWWTYGYSPVRDDDGSIHGVLVVVQETTARFLAVAERERLLDAERRARADAEVHRSEAELARRQMSDLIRQAPAFIAVLRGTDHVFELVNDNYRQLAGHRDIVGKPVLEAFPEVAGQGYLELLDRVLDTGEPFVGREMPLMIARKPGAPVELRHVTFVYHPIVEIDGSRSGILAHGIDVSDSVRARIEIDQARREAEAANKAKSQFLAVISHELRTPLSAIGGYAELMELGIHGPVTDEQRQDLARIQQSQRHVLGLVKQVLDFSRIETNVVDYDLTTVPLGETLTAAAGLVFPQMRARDIEYVAATCAPTLTVRADAERLQQVLLNLLGNAVKFTNQGGRVTTACTSDGTTVSIRISDTGIGIASHKLEEIFEPFVQADAQSSRTRGGVGLGLAISRTFARGMGGDITVESSRGVGSTFTLTLPAA